jgi:hypothetical protein
LFLAVVAQFVCAHESDITIIEHPQSEGAKGKEQERKREHQLFLLRAS